MSFIFNLGFTGVELFFLISGFVVHLTIEKTTNYKNIFFLRFARLYPAYCICLTLTTIAIVSWSVIVKTPINFPQFKNYLLNLSMIQYCFNLKNIDGVYWTLTVELLFYLFILIIYLIKNLRQIEFISFLVVLTCFIYVTGLNRLSPFLYKNIHSYVPIITYFPLFIAGIIFYKIKFYKINRYRFLLIIFCLVTQILLLDSSGRIILITKLQYIAAVFTFFSVFFLYCFNHLHFVINKFTLFLGKISYSLYLFYGFISIFLLIPFLTYSKIFHLNIWIAVLFIVGPIVVIPATYLNKFIEVPVINYFRRKRLKESIAE